MNFSKDQARRRGEQQKSSQLRELVLSHAAPESLGPTRLIMPVIIIELILMLTLQELSRIPAFLIVHIFVAPVSQYKNSRERSQM